MKIVFSIIISVFLFCISVSSAAQFNKQLCKRNEVIVFAFQLKNKKWVSVCKEKNENYIVYRFGSAGKIELQFPSVLDSTSWKQFAFKGFSRVGGKINAAMNYAFLHFAIKDVIYEVYDTWNYEDNADNCGISITIDKKTIDKPGTLKSRKGYLLSLRGNNKIKLEEEN